MKKRPFPPERRERPQRGMTLLEVLVSLLVFSLGILGIVGLQARAIQYSFDAEDRSRAATIANEVVATMWANKTMSLTTAQLAPLQSRAASVAIGGLPNVSIAVTGAASGVATVSITWKSPSKKASDPSSSYYTQVAMP